MTEHPVLGEREALCDLFDELGPDAPTWCEGWTTHDLAAHLWAREHRPDAGPGLVLGGAFARHTHRVEARTARRPYDTLVRSLRSGPPMHWPGRWQPDFDAHEWFVHHEDVRRANGMAARDDLGELDAKLWAALGRFARPLTRRLDVGVRLETPDGRHRTARGGKGVVLTAAPGELLLRLFGRPVQVPVTGDAGAVAAFERGPLGL